MNITLRTSTQFTVIDCNTCGINFAVPESYQRKLAETGQNWWCPNGHKWRYGPTTIEEMEKQLQRERQQHDQTRAALRSETKWHSSTKGQLTKTKNRISKGICPCCKRSFTNLRRHMECKHPDFSNAQ